jgi:hypothetical protein
MDRKCLKGWILAPSPTDGTNVPFFVQVRDKDIVWDEKTLPEELKALVDAGEDKEINYTGAYWSFKKNGWNVKLNVDGSYSATRRLVIGNTFQPIYETSACIEKPLTLPFDTVNDGTFHFSLSVASDNISMKSATSGIYKIDGNTFDNIQIYLQNNQYPFQARFSSANIYSDSYLYIKVEGKVNI